jgi:hypothetical protein
MDAFPYRPLDKSSDPAVLESTPVVDYAVQGVQSQQRLTSDLRPVTSQSSSMVQVSLGDSWLKDAAVDGWPVARTIPQAGANALKLTPLVQFEDLASPAPRSAFANPTSISAQDLGILGSIGIMNLNGSGALNLNGAGPVRAFESGVWTSGPGTRIPISNYSLIFGVSSEFAAPPLLSGFGACLDLFATNDLVSPFSPGVVRFELVREIKVEHSQSAPEPASCLVWGLAALGITIFLRRRSSV